MANAFDLAEALGTATVHRRTQWQDASHTGTNVARQAEVSDADVPSLGTVSVLLFHFKNRQVLQQPVQTCILALLNTSIVCDYTAYQAALKLQFKIITWMNNTVFSCQQ